MIRCCSTKQNNAQASTASKADCKGNQGWSQESMSSPETHQQGEMQQESGDSGYRNRRKNSEISTYAIFSSYSFNATGYLPVVKWKIKTVEGKVPRPGSQLGEVKGKREEEILFHDFFLVSHCGKVCRNWRFTISVKFITQNTLWWMIMCPSVALFCYYHYIFATWIFFF